MLDEELPLPLKTDVLAEEHPFPADDAPIAREGFVPIHKKDLLAKLIAQFPLDAKERQQFELFGKLVESTIKHEFHLQLDQLKSVYVAFDPDADTPPEGKATSTERDALADKVFENLCWICERANFRRLDRETLLEAMRNTSYWGVNLDVDFTLFQHLEVFARGNLMATRSYRRLRRFYRKEQVQLPVYERLFIMFRLTPHERLDADTDTECIYLKLFKSIPRMDIDMLLPGTKIRMTMLDRSKIFFPTVSGIAVTAWKIVQGATVVAMAGAYGVLALLGFAGGTIGYGVRSFLGYLRTKQKYQLNLTRNLYFQNLDNNSGALQRLISEGEEQDFRETILAYFFLWRIGRESNFTVSSLDKRVEGYLQDNYFIPVDFEVHDALRKLRNWNLIEPSDLDAVRAVDIAEAVQRMRKGWQRFVELPDPPPDPSAPPAAEGKTPVPAANAPTSTANPTPTPPARASGPPANVVGIAKNQP